MNGAVTSAADAVRAARRTWGATGVRRRARYELQRRLRLAERAEAAWLIDLSAVSVDLAPIRPVTRPPGASGASPSRVPLYGPVDVDLSDPHLWKADPTTGAEYSDAHWSRVAVPSGSDVKDIWEIGRMSWLGRLLSDPAADDRVWALITSFVRENPPYQGPHWMCGQESALRGIQVSLAGSVLADAPSTTPAHRLLIARAVATSAGRVRPTLGYALSQRNNHAVSEAAFLWTTTYIVDGLPHAEVLRRDAAAALTEVTGDQWYEDGAYAQHSPTYQRLAVHALLWVLAVARAAGVSPPPGVNDAVSLSLTFLSRLLEPTSGHVPNLGGNDGARLFTLTDTPVADFRPLLSHAAAAVGRPSPVPAGPWDDEARWFGLEPDPAGRTPASDNGKGVSHHIHRGRSSFAVLRAGPLRHRPAHADQLHVDVWIDDANVASDAGSYRYSGGTEWSNALAGEEVHNVPRVPGNRQALRRGRFLWVAWREARVVGVHRGVVDATLAELELPGGVRLRRLLLRDGDTHAVVDRGTVDSIIRWNLPSDAAVDVRTGATVARGRQWHARAVHAGVACILQRRPDEPTTGWSSPTYALLEPITALELAAPAGTATATVFGPSGSPLVPPEEALLDAASSAELRRLLA